VGRIEQLQGTLANGTRWRADARRQRPAAPPMVTLQILGGRKEKIRPGDVLGALTKDLGLSCRRALILVPTRELAAQVGEVVRSLAQHLPQPVKGGRGVWRRLHQPADDGLRGGADVVVATPGRLLDLVDHNALQPGRP
jgi:hypothetical protein